MTNHAPIDLYSGLCAASPVTVYDTIRYDTILSCTIPYCTVLCCAVLYWTVLYCTVLYCAVLYCTVLYCTVLLYYIMLYSTQSRRTNACQHRLHDLRTPAQLSVAQGLDLMPHPLNKYPCITGHDTVAPAECPGSRPRRGVPALTPCVRAATPSTKNRQINKQTDKQTDRQSQTHISQKINDGRR